MNDYKIYSIKEVTELVNRSRTTLWRWWSKDKVFPKPILVNGQCLGWKAEDINKWILNQKVKYD